MRMRSLSLLASAVALSGCTVLLQPNYDAIAPDPDAGRPEDAGHDGGRDSGPDGGVDAGCRATQTVETACEGNVDDDCDGQIDCFDFDCRGAAVCCRGGGAPLPMCLQSAADWRRVPTGTSDITLTSSCPSTRITSFGPPAATRALISEQCQPINFGMRYQVDFLLSLACSGSACDYAALSFTPVQTLLDGQPLSSELRVSVKADGSARVDRAGTIIGTLRPGTFVIDTAEPVELQLDLEPGIQQDGDVLFATATLTQNGTTHPILRRTAVLPLDALRCLGGGVGLYAAIEGSGSSVGVVGPLSYVAYECSNPSQFRPQVAIDTSTVEACAPGGAGAPALVNYCRERCDDAGGEQIQWDLWVDGSATQRADERYLPVDFGVCGYAFDRPALPSGAAGDDWVARPAAAGSPFLWAIPPSAREPSLLPVADLGADPRVERIWFAFAERTEPDTEIYALRGGQMLTAPVERPGTIRDLLTPSQTGCESLRDPLLVADWATDGAAPSVAGAWLFFTCVHASGPRSIGVVHLGSDLRPDTRTLRTDVLTSAAGGYGVLGVYAPEGFSEVRGTLHQLTVRLWFFALDGLGHVSLAYAQGRGDPADGLPSLELYPANPILDGSSEMLGGDCSLWCALTGASVTPSFLDLGNYQFMISRSRLTPSGTAHDVVPLLQPAPND